MGLEYRADPDLAFLAMADDDDLSVLVEYLTEDKGEKRYAQQLLDDEAFVAAGKKYSKAWMSIAAELQRYGGDTIVNAFRGPPLSR